MAKTIKFNLICDEKPVRTIEDLQNNFSIEDVLGYYNSKLLHRWLEVRGYTEELRKVSAIVAENPMDILKELIIIFNVESDVKKIEESIYMLQYLEECKELYSIYEKENYSVKHIIDDYEAGYRKLVMDIVNNPYDAAKIKANIAIIVENYKWLLQLNHRNLFYVLMDKSPLAIMCLLMNEHSRKYYLPNKIKNQDGTESTDINNNADKQIMYQKICHMIRCEDIYTKLGENLSVFSGITDGYWKDLETDAKRYMIISMQGGNFVRSAGNAGGDLGYNDIFNNFVILEGIDYKSNNASHQLLYMEV